MAWQIGARRRRVPLVASVACLAVLVGLASFGAKARAADTATATAISGTIGLVVTDLRHAFYETPDKEECPEGLQPGEGDQFRATKNYQDQLAKKGGSFETRGPNGELGNYNPMLIDDPLPFRELKTKHGFGVNLDGTQDGRATAKSCQHEKFTNPDGEKIDNQMARVLGCVQGFRTGGHQVEFRANEIVLSHYNRHLIEISGIEDETNDPSVEVAIYKGLDVLVRTAAGDRFVPLQGHRVDERFPQFILKTRGRITHGVLTTDPIPFARLPVMEQTRVGERRFRDMALHVKLTNEGAEGFLAGYQDISTWWRMQRRDAITELGKFSPAALYRALVRYADGYPDPQTGQCTGISATYRLKATRVVVVHPNKKAPGIAMQDSPRTTASLASAQ